MEGSSIFGVEDRRSKMGATSSKIVGFFEDVEVLRSFGAGRPKNPPILKVLDPKIEEPPNFYSFRLPPPSTNGHQLLSAILRSGYPARSSGRRPADKPLIYCGSTTCFVLPAVYVGFPFFALAKRRSGQLSSMPWGARGTVVSESWANRPVGVRSCPVPPRPAAPLCAAPNRSARGMFEFRIRQVSEVRRTTCRNCHRFSLSEKHDYF